MTIHCSSRAITSDRSSVRAVSVGQLRWVIPVHLRGRTLTAIQALGLVQTADALAAERGYRADDRIWGEMAQWLRPVGMTVLEAAAHLELPCTVEDSPRTLGETPARGDAGTRRRGRVVRVFSRRRYRACGTSVRAR